MANQYHHRLSLEGVEYVIHHLFLPAKLPQKDDFLPEHETLLISLTCRALSTFEEKVEDKYRQTVQEVHKSLKELSRVLDNDMCINEYLLVDSLNDIALKGGSLPIYIKAQNAGLIVSRMGNEIVFESFELTPTNAAVLSCNGRLRREFPASAVAIPLTTFQEDGLVRCFAQAIAKMSFQTVDSTYAASFKSSSSHQEIRDTIHPKIVTEYLMAVLEAFGSRTMVKTIWKNTREEVMYSRTLLPWHRSSLWLMLRVVLNLGFNRAQPHEANSFDLYKAFTVYLLSNILSLSIEHDLDSSIYKFMIAKLSQRLLKLDMSNESIQVLPWIMDTKEAMIATSKVIEARWNKIMIQSQPCIDLTPMKELKPSEDTIVELPKVDEFVREIASREDEKPSSNFTPSAFHQPKTFEEPPLQLDNCGDEYELPALALFETWVGSHFGQWVKGQSQNESTCILLSDMIKKYHQFASRCYNGNPELLSNMVLTILELWIACDMVATKEYSMLGDYDPEIRFEILQSLILPFQDQLCRLHTVEQYLRQRRAESKQGLPSIFRNFGALQSFAVRFFNECESLQALRRSIETTAADRRAKKCVELKEKWSTYEDLMQKFEESTCDFESVLVDQYGEVYEDRHQVWCHHCKYKNQAQELTIDIYEWPLSPKNEVAKATVFELDVPALFREWRSTTIYLLVNVLLFTYDKVDDPNQDIRFKLQDDLSLGGQFRRGRHSTSRLEVASAIKPNARSHYRGKQICLGLRDEDVCLNNGLIYQYLDSEYNVFTGTFLESEQFHNSCTFILPGRSVALQSFLVRPHQLPNGHEPNEVLARQSQCPEHMSLDEFRAFASLPLGYSIQWHNLLVQLAMPSLDFAKLETTIMLSQIIWQAGPSYGDSNYRETHGIIVEKKFTECLLLHLHQRLHKVKENWKSMWTLLSHTRIAARCLSFVTSSKMKQRFLHFLEYTRNIAYTWFKSLRHRIKESTSHAHRNEVLVHLIEVALICVSTLDIDDALLRNALKSSATGSIYLHCSMTIQENSILLKGCSPFMSILCQCWRRAAFKLSKILADMVVIQEHRCLDEAIRNYWPGYQYPNTWQRCAIPVSHWLQTSITMRSDRITLDFNSLTSELLVNGLPLSHLPIAYQNNQTYSTLFGKHSLEVMPALTHGMAFTAKDTWAGFNVSLQMQLACRSIDKLSDELLVVAEKDGDQYDFLPRSLFQSHLPHALVKDFIHWYHHNTKSILLIPVSQPWSLSAPVWQLNQFKTGWGVEMDDVILVDPASKTASYLSKIFAPLEDPPYIHILFRSPSAPVIVELPRLQLKFLFQPGTTSMESREFRGYLVDSSQNIGTLIGMSNKMVLRRRDSNERLVLIPNGNLAFTKSCGHILISSQRSVAKVFPYRIDDQLGRIVDNGSLESKLLLAYIHALSSYCLPDPLIGRTGTEQAIYILQSAAVRSFPNFQQEHLDVLENITQLAPVRRFYPSHLEVMQEVTWNGSLNSMSQDSLLIPPVQAIFNQVKESHTLHPQSSVEPPILNFGSSKLLDRDLHRSSMYRSGHGKDYFNVSSDAQYLSRDRSARSLNGNRAYNVARFIQRDSSILFIKPSHNLQDILWSTLQNVARVLGSSREPSQLDLLYDASWFKDPLDSLRPQWYTMIESIRSMRQHKEKFRFIIWLSSVAFTEKMDQQILQVLAAYYVLPKMWEILFPVGDHFQLSLGIQPDVTVLRVTILTARKEITESPEADLLRQQEENQRSFTRRRQKIHNENRESAIDMFISHLKCQWPCESPSPPPYDQIGAYIHIDKATVKVKENFRSWHANLTFRKYLGMVEQAITACVVLPFPISCCVLKPTESQCQKRVRYVHIRDLFDSFSPGYFPVAPRRLQDLFHIENQARSPNAQLIDLLVKMKERSHRSCETEYADDLLDSMAKLRESATPALNLGQNAGEIKKILTQHLNSCSEYTEAILSTMKLRIISSRPLFELLNTVSQGPRISPIDLLQSLLPDNWISLGRGWRGCIIKYGLSLTELQRAKRLLRLKLGTPEFVAELLNFGHTNWSPNQFPQHLLLEVESGIMIREKQEVVAAQMRHPLGDQNVTMQMNMGEGKSSVVVPIVVLPLTDGDTLVRVITGRPQARQMFTMLLSKVSGILNRRIYHLPFSREIILNKAKAKIIHKICEECRVGRGILLIQPEQILSLKLMSIERLLASDMDIAGHLLRTLRSLDRARDVVDECDDNFSVKFELVYTIGTQKPIDFSPQRWHIVLEVLDLFRQSAEQVQKERPSSIQIDKQKLDRYPKIRILEFEVSALINQSIARSICQQGLVELPLAHQPDDVQEAAFEYMTKPNLTAEMEANIQRQMGPFWTESKKQSLLLIRGLLAGGIFVFAFGLKRWRVNYGIDPRRVPATKLAIPFRGKDNPSPRSEFSHPEVVLVLTALSYLYGGMNSDDIFTSLDFLLRTDGADCNYREWVHTAPNLPNTFRQLSGVNKKDRVQCEVEIFPHLRFSKGLIDFFLSQVVFPKHMRQFRYKLSASGWDIGEKKHSILTGFSGTNDSRQLLPLSVGYLDSIEQRHTNALVLHWLLHDRNGVHLIPPRNHISNSETEHILSNLTELRPQIRVILDVGAQLLELDNRQIAKLWLELTKSSEDIEAVVFLDELHELKVLDRNQHCELLQSSPYTEKMDCCLIYLDEIHTRGIDLVLPPGYRAAVTLGAGLTKDRLVQACMRMRRLESSHSIMFCVPSEIACKIRSLEDLQSDEPILVSNVIAWAISGTMNDLRRSIALWASQGRRHIKHRKIWNRTRTDESFSLTLADAKEFLEQEALTLSERYSSSNGGMAAETDNSDDEIELCRIHDNLVYFGGDDSPSATFHEEQERELAPEIEQERQVEGPRPATAERNHLHNDVMSFARTGKLRTASEAFLPAFDILQNTSAAKVYQGVSFPKGILVTKDFATTIESRLTLGDLDSYQRSVQWIVTSLDPEGSKVGIMLIISPYEAYRILSVVRKERKVTLHIYAPRQTEESTCLDHLSLFTEGRPFLNVGIPDSFVIQLGLFAGQVYFDSYKAYCDSCDYLGLRWNVSGKRNSVDGDGFIVNGPSGSAFDKSPIEILKILMYRVRRHGQDIGKTHLGKMLGGRILDVALFDRATSEEYQSI